MIAADLACGARILGDVSCMGHRTEGSVYFKYIRISTISSNLKIILQWGNFHCFKKICFHLEYCSPQKHGGDAKGKSVSSWWEFPCIWPSCHLVEAPSPISSQGQGWLTEGNPRPAQSSRREFLWVGIWSGYFFSAFCSDELPVGVMSRQLPRGSPEKAAK